ncbi:ALK tyrosine kinase receptor [Belonocnema kinseyi]|uniref:ALK tyrosine kinase receptor n=1 Tax=Belonocnema kinseyi TaxID=2817044 RepID=UPI00143D9B5C|nr:ALK tyrosine kinase receptor [Belonocnema kinseyi]
MIKVGSAVITILSSCYLPGRRGSVFLSKVVLTFYCIVSVYCDQEQWSSRVPRGIKDLQRMVLNAAQSPPFLGHCDFEEPCDWAWNETDGFKLTKPPVPTQLGPTTDASNDRNGHFLWLNNRKEGQLWSIPIPRTGSRCLLDLAWHQVQMKSGTIRLVIETYNHTSWVAAERWGNDHAKWEQIPFNLGAISQTYKLILEVTMPALNSSVAIDNIRLVDCFPENPGNVACTPDMFRCNNGSCLNKTRVCDLTQDCADGEDELQECDKVPEIAKCNFETGWCGWKNVPGRPLNWTLHQGPTPTDRTGPSYDHTFRNATGTFAYVNMSKRADYGSRGTISSPLYNPTPPYSSDPTSPYFQSCQVRFFYHQYGAHSGSLGLYLVQVGKHQNQTDRLWWTYGDQKDAWYNQAVALPDVRVRYFLQFEASRAYASKGDVAIDDFSLSPECFGIGVPPEVLKGYNYYDPVIESSVDPENQSLDFMNETVVRISTCGQLGRMGPTVEQCANEHNGTDIELLTPSPLSASTNEETPAFNLNGIQRWTAPRGGYYTIIAMGARGGRGSGGMGSTLGTLVRCVIELEKEQQLYFMVGQPGLDACPKSLGLERHECQQSSQAGSSSIYTSKVHAVKKIELKDGGGGGGGATYIFTLKPNGEHLPLMIAAGGGGLGLGQFVDDGVQHGKGPPPPGRNPVSGVSVQGDAGAGGGWNGSSNNNSTPSAGMPLIFGGIGGVGCGTNNKGHGDGGFGGGGGGCLTGGGGGGYIGGSTGGRESPNGQGGYSFAASELLHVSFQVGYNQGPGEVLIIPGISGCGCDFRCVVLDQHRTEVKCLCPLGWLLGNNSKTCEMAEESDVAHQTFMIILISFSIGLMFALSGLFLLLYNRYQHRKALIRRRQVMFGNGTELTALRAVSDSMMTEFNPNYEFAGNLYSFKDLPQIPRDNISLLKPLGQGAFGEVFQGVYKYRRNEEHPVAVKTLPSLSTSQAEADFMMEALIMSKFNHPNIVHFIGVSFDKHPRYIVLELLAGGDLKNFLREERPRPDRPTTLAMQDLVMCAFDVANGCKYMEDARFIHRDIAARNCLLTSKGAGRIVKIADFGMARDIYRSDYYRKGGKAMLPIKWMPPESFLDGIFTTKTDVWAFGVLLWEIMSFGYMPYTGCANREVMSMVTTGGRLERPAGCPDPIYGVMTRCWHPHPEDRPSFNTIVERIGYCLQDPDVLNHPMPNYDILPVCEREITIMRPDPETECINVHADLDGCGYMQPRANFRPTTYRIGNPIPGIVYASLKHPVDYENENDNIQETTLTLLTDQKNEYLNTCNPSTKELEACDNKEHYNCETKEAEEKNANNMSSDHKGDSKLDDRNSNVTSNKEESSTITDSNSESLAMPSSTPPDTAMSSPNTRTSSPIHTNRNSNANNINGLLRKSALKAALSLDPSTLCRGNIPYEKIAFSPPPPRMSNPGSMELRKDSLGHELAREEECSC